ncbi:cytochrome bd oxidase small subunit CydS [Paenibacillus sp. NRS-1760]
MEFTLIMIAPLLIIVIAVVFLFVWGAKGQTSPRE